MLRVTEQANLLDYEAGVSLFKPVEPLAGKRALRTPPEEVPAFGPNKYFKFDDEYWTDELENMRFLIEDRCVD